MDVDPEVVKAVANKLRDRDSLPPGEAVLALVALAGEPDQAIGLVDGSNWTIVAVARGGLVVVEVAVPDGRTWARRSSQRPEGATLTARWYPATAVRGTEVVDVYRYQDASMQGLDLAGRYEWLIHVEGCDPIALPRDPTNRNGAVDELVGGLQASVATRVS